jgi:hypothetical protein
MFRIGKEEGSQMNQFANSTSEEGKGRTTRNFHKVMDAMMRGMVEAQAGKDCRLKKVPLKLCGSGLLLISSVLCSSSSTMASKGINFVAA